MSTTVRIRLLFSLAAAFSLAGCAPDDEEVAPNREGLAGKWRLASRQCYCVPGPPPNETATFTATDFWFYKNNQLISSGSYSAAPVTVCGIPAAAPGLRFADANRTYGAIATQRGDSLVLDYGGPCDAPVDTYVRLP